jgi:tRNA(fMet)-specific endonuclease VapC
MFDTDTASFFMKNNPNIRRKTEEHSKDEFCISAITYAELMFGLKRNYSKQLDYWLKELLGKFKLIAFDDTSAVIYGDIRTMMEKSGTPIDNMDLLIAACAISSGATLISHNTKHYSKIKGLKVEDWY